MNSGQGAAGRMHWALLAAQQMVSQAGGVKVAAAMLDKNATSLAHELQAQGTAKLGLVCAADLSVATGCTRLIDAWAAQLGLAVVPLQVRTDPQAQRAKTPLQAVVALSHEGAAVADVFAAALSDGRVSDNELTEVLGACAQLQAALRGVQVQAVQAHTGGGAQPRRAEGVA